MSRFCLIVENTGQHQLVIILTRIYNYIIRKLLLKVYMSFKDKEKWDTKYDGDSYITGKEPCEWLKFHTEFLIKGGKALDIAAGEGRNSVFAASLGYEVVSMDISEIALKKAQRLAKEKNVTITTLFTDLDNSSLPENEYDLVLCFNFLERKLSQEIRKTLKSGGILFYETFSIDYLKYSSFKKEWVLEQNELLEVFNDLRILRYQEAVSYTHLTLPTNREV